MGWEIVAAFLTSFTFLLLRNAILSSGTNDISCKWPPCVAVILKVPTLNVRCANYGQIGLGFQTGHQDDKKRPFKWYCWFGLANRRWLLGNATVCLGLSLTWAELAVCASIARVPCLPGVTANRFKMGCLKVFWVSVVLAIRCYGSNSNELWHCEATSRNA